MYVRLRFKFDENLFNKKRSAPNQLAIADEQFTVK